MGRLCYPTKHRAGSWYFSQKAITVQGGYGTCFCRPGTNFIASLRVSRYKFDRSREFIPGYKFGWRALAQCRGTNLSKPEIYHGARVSLQADARVQVHRTLRICLGCRSKSKKCDKQLTHIVRVRCSCYLFLFLFQCSLSSHPGILP